MVKYTKENDMKSKLLNIPKDLITKNGAVSEIVAFYMAKNSLKILKSHLSRPIVK